MKTVNKIIACCSCIIFFMLLFPLIVIKLSAADFGTGFLMTLFFMVYPVLSMGIGMVAGTDIRRLWWFPLAVALPFPFLFAAAISEIVWELYVYSVLYFGWSAFFMAMTAVIKRIIKKASEKKNEEYRKK